MEKRIIVIEEIDDGLRLDQFLARELVKFDVLQRYLSTLSRTFIKEHLIEDIEVNDKVQKPSYRLKKGDKVEVSIAAVQADLEQSIVNKGESIEPQRFDLKIIEEREDFLVLDKPHGMVVHPGVGNPKDTLANYLKGYMLEKGVYDEQLNRAGIIHRLDKAVGGLMIVAKSANTQVYLKKQFEQHRVLKIYLADVVNIDQVSKSKSFEDLETVKKDLSDIWCRGEEIEMSSWTYADGFVGRNQNDRIKMEFSKLKLNPSFRSAKTYFLRVGESQLAIRIITGRMHQIRATLNYYGAFVEGDSLYGVGRGLPKNIKLFSSLLGVELENGEKSVWSL